MQRRFQFRLARLLRIREVTERVAREAWAAAQATARAAQAEHADQRDRLARARTRFREDLLSGARAASSLIHEQSAMDGQLLAIRRSAELAATRVAQAERAREAWREKELDRHALQDLRERARVAHTAALAAVDQAEMDEMSMQRSQRMSRSSAPPSPAPESPGAAPSRRSFPIGSSSGAERVDEFTVP